MSGSALEGGAIFEGEVQAAIRVGRGVVQQAAPERQGTVLCLDCVFSAVGESEEQRAYRITVTAFKSEGIKR